MAPAMTSEIEHAVRSSFQANGFYISREAVDPLVVQGAIAHMDAVVAGQYETGVPPLDLTRLATAEQLEHLRANPRSTKICKIDQAHFCDKTIHRLISDPAIGRLAAAATGALWVQVWATQLLLKPPGDGGSASVGWHQDLYYWQTVWEGETFTAWLALSDVTPDAGPMRFVRGSHRWGMQDGSDFFDVNLEGLKEKLKHDNADWDEVPSILPPGGVSLHHNLTLHGSGANRSSGPRRSIAIHLRTEKSKPIAKHPYTMDLDDPIKCPVIFQA
jgi:ectoine hydroxylase-related dioxygenase (phytanoyl-CoA dioxygenase family)